jgi:two-component system response regulator YesN
MPNVHVLKTEILERRAKLSAYSAVDQGHLDPALIQGFIQNGLRTEIEDFVTEYYDRLGDACDSLMFRHYLLLSARINALAAAEALGLDREQLAQRLPQPELDAPLALREYFTQVLRTAIDMRDEESIRQSGGIVDSAVAYIDLHYTDENISLNTVARAINVSTNYLSAMFSQKTGMSFVEYLTQKRMTRAKQLLRQGGKRSGEVAAEIGYRDPRYFSFVFKKTQGCTPREYRAGEMEK